ncbi:MAG: PQQ-binding-like beta-propeller repeat protein [Opitutaceae bacterium]|nr:PQQ-binding-like beta-propeller repeat protein [Opitutaceae bacterium]
MSTSARLLVLSAALGLVSSLSAASGWLHWRGPTADGVSPAKQKLTTDLALGGPNHRWTYKAHGAGTPVIADGRVFAMCYYGENGEEVEEAIIALDVKTGAKLWEHRFKDFISDTVYNRYAIGAPYVDAETGNVYCESVGGVITALTRDGKIIWQRSMMEEFGRLTFPNGRTGSLITDGDFMYAKAITANWGTDGPARSRYYAFDKRTGELIWASTPGTEPVDNPFGAPLFADLGGHRVFYVGTGCGHVVCINARTGEPVWRFKFSNGGLNSDVLLDGPGKLIAIHGKENIDSSSQGRLVALKIPTEYPTGPKPVILGKDAELWRNDEFSAFSSSPLLVNGRVYATNANGTFTCADAATGRTLWSEKLGADQVHASPAFADGRFYVPMHEGHVFVIEVKNDKPVIISNNKMEAGTVCLGAPAFYGDSIFIFTKDGLHSFGPKATAPIIPAAVPPPAPSKLSTAPIVALQVVPAEFALYPGQSQTLKVWGLDATGRRVRDVTKEATFAKFIPPTALVKAEVDAELTGSTIKAGPAAKLSAGSIQAKWNNLAGTTRGRVIATYGHREDFESLPLGQKNNEGTDVGFPPLAWLGARVKWHIFEKDGNKFAGNRLDSLLFMRTMNFIGGPDMKNYTFEADVMTDGNRRVMSNVGLVNQRYLFVLAANNRVLEISSTHERFHATVPFEATANTWYRLKTRVDRDKTGEGGFVRAKLWPRGEPEPAKWTIEARQNKLHQHGAPAVYAFSPQSMKRVFIDNLAITANE